MEIRGRHWNFLIGVVLSVLASGCAASTATAPNSPTSTTPTIQTTSVRAFESSSPRQIPASTSVASSSASAPADASTVRLAIVPDASEASFAARELLIGRPLPVEAIGRTNAISGEIVLRPDGSIVEEQSEIKVNLTKLKSDESRRDSFIQRETLQTSQFPEAVFVPHRIEGLSQPVPTVGEATFTIAGDLTVRGVTTPVTWNVNASFGPQDVNGTAETSVTFDQLSLTPPKAGPVLSVENALRLQLDFQATREEA